MNIGSKVRFTTLKGASGRPEIHWERVMDNRRGNQPRVQRKNPGARPTGRGRGDATVEKSVAQKNPRPRQKGSANSEITPGTVTLTQTQLDAILSTVGSLMNENQKLQSQQLDNNGGKESGDKDYQTGRSDVSESLFNLANGSPSKPVSKPGSGVSYRGPSHVEPDSVPGLGRIERSEDNHKVVAPSAVPGLGAVNAPSRPADIPKAHMTKAELKRLQWERERADVGFAKDTPLFGVGGRKPPPSRHNILSPVVPRAHLTKAERLRIKLEEAREEALSNPVSPGRSLTQFWSNKNLGSPRSEVDTPLPAIPKAHLTKAEKKRKQWEEERVENEEREARSNNAPPPRSRQAEPQNTAAALPPTGNVPRAHLSKAELKRLQWEKERADNQALDMRRANISQEGKPSNLDLNEGTAYVPSFGTTKLDIKRRQWEKERAENGEPDNFQIGGQQINNRRPPPHSPNEAIGQSYVPTTGTSKAELKRRQWEKERAEIEGQANFQIGDQQPPSRGRPRQSPTATGTVGQGLVSTPGNSKAELKRRQWEKERAENDGLEDNFQFGNHHQPTHGRRSYPVPTEERAEAGTNNIGFGGGQPASDNKQMSKSEMKRLQWQRERQENEKAEQQGEYNPWGKPGAGAPVRDPSGNILSDYNQRQDDHEVRNSYQEPPEFTSSAAPPPDQSAIIQKYRYNQSTQQAGTGAMVSETEANQPAAIRSSFAFGNAAPDDKKFMSVKEREKREWLQELERQREEKRLQKLNEKEKWKQEEAVDMWADRYAPPKNPAPPVPPQQDLRASSAPTVEPTSVPGLDLDPSSQQNAFSPRASQQDGNFLRGQNAYVDPASRKDMDERRRRQLEHQEAIKAQVEENQRKKQEDRDRRAREEMEEERKLQAERDALQAMYDNERKKAQDKEDTQRRRLQSLKDAMDAAAEDAHREKHARRMAKLQKGGHDISHLNANFEDSHQHVSGVPPSRQAVVSDTELLYVKQAKMTPRAGVASVQQVAPSSVPGLDLTPRDVALHSSVSTGHDPYISNRVIVPTKYKEPPSLPFSDPTSPRREFGVQTDAHLTGGPFGETKTLSRESTDIEYKGPFKSDKKVRIKSSDGVKNKKINERPKWGVRNTKQTVEKKKPVKQSEKDPYFEKRRIAREAQKLQRQKDMMEMAEKSLARARNMTTMRARSKSRDKNQGDTQTIDQRSKSLGRGSNRGASPTVLKTRSNQASPPPRSNNPSRRRSSPDPVPSHRSKSDNPQTQRRSRRDTQENRPPLVNGHRSEPVVQNGYHSKTTPRGMSPPVPSLASHRNLDLLVDSNAYHVSKPSNLKQDTSRSRYSDLDPVGAPRNDGDFVPFVRTAAILDPQIAEVPLPMSREATAVETARKAYIHGIQPASYGSRMPNYEDRHIKEAAIPEMPSMPEPEWSKDPIINPGIFKDHPTGRQDRILQQLSDLRRGLMQKQRELEVASPLIDM